MLLALGYALNPASDLERCGSSFLEYPGLIPEYQSIMLDIACLLKSKFILL
jgi:hypothetical protein